MTEALRMAVLISWGHFELEIEANSALCWSHLKALKYKHGSSKHYYPVKILKIWSLLPSFLKADREQTSKILSVENQTKGYFCLHLKTKKLEGVSSAKHSKYFFLSCIQLTRHVPTCHFNSGKLCSKHMRSRLCKVFILSSSNRKLHLTETRGRVRYRTEAPNCYWQLTL